MIVRRSSIIRLSSPAPTALPSAAWLIWLTIRPLLLAAILLTTSCTSSAHIPMAMRHSNQRVLYVTSWTLRLCFVCNQISSNTPTPSSDPPSMESISPPPLTPPSGSSATPSKDQ
ncbi:MAG: hypothetical protein [Microviridae sp.]|nr:MAG: hypothetical protein [Microviridae sp.]